VCALHTRKSTARYGRISSFVCLRCGKLDLRAWLTLLLFFLSAGDGYPVTQDEFEMQADAIAPGQTVVIVDDVIATGAHFHILLDTMTGL
jgi:hypothetical protein